MAYNILALKGDLTGVIHGTTLNQITNLDALIYRAARQVLLDCDPQETKRIAQFANPIFTNVYSYALPTDLKGNKVIDIRPQVNRTYLDIYPQDYSQQFDLAKQAFFPLKSQFNINFNSAVKTILINAPFLTAPVTINSADNITDNGTWVVGGGASNLSVDNTNFVAGSGSLKFDLAAGQSSGYLENSTMSAVDLSDFLNQAYNFLYSFLPTGSSFTGISLRFGSSSSNYYSLNKTVTQENTAFQNGWNLMAYPWASMSVTGSPDPSSIKYVRITWTYDSTAQTGVRLNSITSALGSILEIVYYSKYLFRDSSTGAFQETVTDDSNLINLDTESYGLLLDQVAYLVSQQTQGIDAEFFDANFWLQKYAEDLSRYKAMYKSEIQKPQQKYYNQPRPGYARYFRRWNW